MTGPVSIAAAVREIDRLTYTVAAEVDAMAAQLDAVTADRDRWRDIAAHRGEGIALLTGAIEWASPSPAITPLSWLRPRRAISELPAPESPDDTPTGAGSAGSAPVGGCARCYALVSSAADSWEARARVALAQDQRDEARQQRDEAVSEMVRERAIGEWLVAESRWHHNHLLCPCTACNT